MRGLKAYSQQLIYNFSQSPTLYWVSSDPGRDSVLHVKVTICAGWFPKVLRVDFLVPGVCGHSWTVSSVGAGAGSSAGASSVISAISAFSSFLSENTESDTEAVLNFVWVTRSQNCAGHGFFPH